MAGCTVCRCWPAWPPCWRTKTRTCGGEQWRPGRPSARAAATPDFLDRLADLLANENEEIRKAAANAVGAIGPAAATPAILTRLAELLAGQNSSAAVEAVKAIGPAAATPDFLVRLAARLADGDRDVRRAAAEPWSALVRRPPRR